MPTQHWDRNIVGRNMLRAFGHRVATCWVFLAQVWKWSNLSQQHPTCRNGVAKRTQQHVSPINVALACCLVWPVLKTAQKVGGSKPFSIQSWFRPSQNHFQKVAKEHDNMFPIPRILRSCDPGRWHWYVYLWSQNFWLAIMILPVITHFRYNCMLEFSTGEWSLNSTWPNSVDCWICHKLSPPNRNTRSWPQWLLLSKTLDIRNTQRCITAREEPLFCSLNPLCGDVLVAVAVVFCIRSLTPCLHYTGEILKRSFSSECASKCLPSILSRTILKTQQSFWICIRGKTRVLRTSRGYRDLIVFSS